MTPPSQTSGVIPPADRPPLSIWQMGGPIPVPALDKSATCDVCIVGGGVSGLTTAFELAARKLHVIVLDADTPGSGQTARSTAHIVTALDERYFALEAKFGPDIARAAANAHARAIAWIDRVCGQFDAPCGFQRVTGTLVVPRSREHDARKLLERERDAAHRAGVECSLVEPTLDLPGHFPGGALQFPNQAQVHPLQLLGGLALTIGARGGQIHGSTRVTRIQERPGHVVVHTESRHTITAQHVVIATHDIPAQLTRRLRRVWPSVSYVVAFDVETSNEPVVPALLWDGYWDDHTPYHYVRLISGSEIGLEVPHLLLVGGEDEVGRQPRDPDVAYQRIEAWTRGHFPLVGPRRLAWWGRILEPDGELAMIGRAPGMKRTSIIAGDSGNGMTYAVIAAELLADLVQGVNINPFEARMFDPARRSDRRSDRSRRSSNRPY